MTKFQYAKNAAHIQLSHLGTLNLAKKYTTQGILHVVYEVADEKYIVKTDGKAVSVVKNV